MKNETIIILKVDKMNGGYDYLEFNTETKEYTVGNSGAHRGHGNYLMRIEVNSKRELKEHILKLASLEYKEIETFGG